jgi:hypothetical protein
LAHLSIRCRREHDTQVALLGEDACRRVSAPGPAASPHQIAKAHGGRLEQQGRAGAGRSLAGLRKAQEFPGSAAIMGKRSRFRRPDRAVHEVTRMLSLPRLLGRHLAKFLSKPRRHRSELPTSPPQLLQAALRKGDVLLVEGNSRFSTAIKYLSQSTWSHAALYIGDHLGPTIGDDAPTFCDVDINVGVRLVGLSEFAGLHTRICRPVGLGADEIAAVVDYMVSRVGNSYDLKNIVDLARYLIRTPPLPSSVKRRFLELGSGEPTKAICSTLLAQAFGAIRYPILPEIGHVPMPDDAEDAEILHHRHHSLYLPRDFDVSPYFNVVKPRLQAGFDFHRLLWHGDQGETASIPRRAYPSGPQQVHARAG